MTNEELKKKIVDVLRGNIEYELHYFPDDNYTEVEFDYDKIADALIAANIGDVTEWREKVECAKRILQISTLPNGTTDLSYFEYKGERIQDIARQRDEYKHRAEIAERALENIIKQYWCDERGCNECEEKQGCIEGIRSRYIQQAEREIEEEER